jgi:hypothetical protein
MHHHSKTMYVVLHTKVSMYKIRNYSLLMITDTKILSFSKQILAIYKMKISNDFNSKIQE